jgi:hypothetical protein
MHCPNHARLLLLPTVNEPILVGVWYLGGVSISSADGFIHHIILYLTLYGRETKGKRGTYGSVGS